MGDIGKLAHDIYQLLKDIDPDERKRVVNSTLILLGDSDRVETTHFNSLTKSIPNRNPSFIDHEDLSPKQFLEEKSPNNDIERAACLAYYLTHYREIQHFKTTDISKLNTEAAQLKFNITRAVDNASTKGLLTPSIKSHKQISAIGEKYVEALPDKEEAKQIYTKMKPRRKRSVSKKKPKFKNM